MEITIETLPNGSKTVIVNGVSFDQMEPEFQWHHIRLLAKKENMKDIFLKAISPDDFTIEKAQTSESSANPKITLCQK